MAKNVAMHTHTQTHYTKVVAIIQQVAMWLGLLSSTNLLYIVAIA